MCKAAGKLFGHYRELNQTQAFLEELSSVIGIPITDLVQVIQGGIPELQGTWVPLLLDFRAHAGNPGVAGNLGASPSGCPLGTLAFAGVCRESYRVGHRMDVG